MLRILCSLLLLFSVVFSTTSYTTCQVYAEEESSEGTSDDSSEENKKDNGVTEPPFPGGPVTSPMGWRFHPIEQKEKFHAGIDVGIDHVEIKAPCDGWVTHGSGNGFGDGWVYFYTDPGNINVPTLRLLFGDLGPETGSMKPGPYPVSKGETIGYVNGYDPNVADGAHVHVQEYDRDPGDPNQPFLAPNEGCIDPVQTLLDLGVDLSGKLYSGSGGGTIGSDSPDVSFDIEMLKTLGDELNKLINDWTDFAIKAVGNITPYVAYLIGLLCIIDLTLPIILAGMVFSLNKLVVKIMKYAAIYAIVFVWPQFINQILINFITSVSHTLDPTMDVTANITQPQLLLQKAVYIISPVFQKIGTFTKLDYMRNIGPILALYAMTLLIMGFYMACSIYITFVYLEFYISAGLSLASVPFVSWGKSKFIAEGSLGHLISTAIKLLFISILVAMSAMMIKDFEPQDIFKVSTTGARQEQTVGPSANPSAKADIGSIDNPYIGMIIEVAQKYNVDPNIALAIAMRESGGDTLEGICMPSNCDGIFQIKDDQEGYDLVTRQRLKMAERFKNLKTDPEQNAEAGMCILLDKINMAGGDVWLGVKWYNSADPNQGDPDYDTKVAANYKYLTGLDVSLLGHTGITSAMLIKYLKLALAMISVTFLIILLPGRVMRVLGGPLELKA